MKQLTAAKLRACIPYNCDKGKFLQLPFVPFFQHTIVNGTGVYFQESGLEQGFPPEYDFLVHGLGSIVSLPYMYARIQWPNGHYLSQNPVDMFNFGGTGRNGRLFTEPIFIPKGDTARIDVGTQQAAATLQLFFEGCILIPA